MSRASSIVCLLVLSAFSINTAFILDTDGEPLRNGGQYYIIPQSIGIGGGLTLKSKTETSPCPYYIARDADETSPGIPVTISSPFRIAIITPSLPISIVFKDTPNICMQPLGWQVVPDETTGKSYVATGATGFPFNPTETFSIELNGENQGYKIRNGGEDREVGIFEKDGFLGITGDIPLPVTFKKAFDAVATQRKTILQMY